MTEFNLVEWDLKIIFINLNLQEEFKVLGDFYFKIYININCILWLQKQYCFIIFHHFFFYCLTVPLHLKYLSRIHITLHNNCRLKLLLVNNQIGKQVNWNWFLLLSSYILMLLTKSFCSQLYHTNHCLISSFTHNNN